MSITQADFDWALERVVAGLQQRKVLTEKERRILAYHEGGHALMAHLMGSVMELQKVTIVSRGNALGYAFYLPEEDRYLHTKEELIDRMIVALAGRAAEEVVFGRVTNGAANDLEKVTEIARSMVFEWGMSDTVTSRTMRADNYALSEATKRLRDEEQAHLTDGAYEEAVRLLRKHRAPLDRIAAALLEKETLVRDELQELVEDVEPESSASETVGVPRVVASEPGELLRLAAELRDIDGATRCRERHRPVPVVERDRSRLALLAADDATGYGLPVAADVELAAVRGVAEDDDLLHDSENDGEGEGAHRGRESFKYDRRMETPTSVHHVGLAVEDLDGALDTYERLFGARLEHRSRVEEQGVEAASIRVGESRLELLGALGEDTPVGRFLAKRGPGMHHVAYEVDDIRAALAHLADAGAELIDETPRRGMFGLEVAFVHPDSVHGVLSEVVAVG